MELTPETVIVMNDGQMYSPSSNKINELEKNISHMNSTLLN